MTENPSTFTQSLDVAERLSAEELVVDLEGFEGPLDLLLTPVSYTHLTLPTTPYV